MPTNSVDLGGDQEMYIFLSSLDDSDIQPGLESLLFGICLQLPQKIFFLTVLGIPLSSKFLFSFFFLSQPGFQWVFNLFPPCNYPCQGHHHFFLILLNSSKHWIRCHLAHPLTWNTSSSWLPHVGCPALRFFLLSSFSGSTSLSSLRGPFLELWLGSLFWLVCTLLLGDPTKADGFKCYPNTSTSTIHMLTTFTVLTPDLPPEVPTWHLH